MKKDEIRIYNEMNLFQKLRNKIFGTDYIYITIYGDIVKVDKRVDNDIEIRYLGKVRKIDVSKNSLVIPLTF